MTRVHADLLSALLILVDTLKNEMALIKGGNEMLMDMVAIQSSNTKLSRQNRDTQDNLATTDGHLRALLRNSGDEFYLFTTMPCELQRIHFQIPFRTICERY